MYAISLVREGEAIAESLDQLAQETGGRRFLTDSVTELDAVYRTIEEELRSQYLLVYRPTEPRDASFRPIEVKVLRPGLTARGVQGY